ncbi:MAG TPA: tRNA (guanosine(37)-N1)-methyltransferase TrmD, partial [Pseudonocardiaceae bacterium]|nr:tRNA (guanosine(37)-N1)-methyltransferase TrmD [Pseudonocardiaceae bacterium]
AAITRWRRDRAVERTAARRPDLLAALPPGALDDADRALLEEPTPPG